MAKRSLEDRSERQASNVFVSFSKRRRGLFQKAAELCSKCDAQIAIVVLSPTGNPFAFGHSSVDEVFHHYLCQTTINPSLLTDEHRQQKQRIEGLKFSLKQGQNKENRYLDEESKAVLRIKEWIDKECEERQSVQELEFLKQKLLALLNMITERLESPPSTTNEIGIISNYYGGGDNNVLGNHVRSSELITLQNPSLDQNSDSVFSGGGGLHGPVGYGGMGGGVFDHHDLIKNVHSLNDMSYTSCGSNSFALNVPPSNDVSCADYGINPVALDFHPQNGTSYNNHGNTSGAWNVHPHNGTSYADYGTISAAVGLLGNRIQGDAGFRLSGYDLLGGLKSEIQ